MKQDTSWEGNHRFIRWFAAKALRRALSAGVRGVQLDDFVQEATVAWLIAVRHFDPSKGVPFIPYLKLGMQRQINRWLQGEINQCHEASVSLDFTPDDSATPGFKTADKIDNGDLAIDEALIRKDTRDKVLALLTPRARRYLELLESPPPELLEEMKALIAKAQIGRAMGITRFAPVRVSSDLIFKLMGAPNHERQKIHREIDGAIKRVTE